MMNISKSILDEIGNTPLCELSRFGKGCRARIVAKLECFNPISIKDRPVLSMIQEAEANGRVNQDTTIIEASSGNTAMALAFICAMKGYRLIVCMSEAMSEERKRVLRAFGAELVLTPAKLHTAAAKAKASELNQQIPNSFYIDQHNNPANTAAHIAHTANEIWNDTDGNVDIVVAGLGSTGTAMGVARTLKPQKPNLKVIGVEPDGAAMLKRGTWSTHKIPGLSPGFVPGLYSAELIDDIITVNTDAAYATCRQLARLEGMLVGPSSGAVAYAAKQLCHDEDQLIVCIFADSGQMYLSNDELFGNA